jgi:hypothetical protein
MCSMLVNKVDFLHGILGVRGGFVGRRLWKTSVENCATRVSLISALDGYWSFANPLRIPLLDRIHAGRGLECPALREFHSENCNS